MKTIEFQFINGMLKRITKLMNIYKDTLVVEFQEHKKSHCTYWLIQFYLQYDGSNYNDNITFYLNEKNFDMETNFEDFDKLIEKFETLYPINK